MTKLWKDFNSGKNKLEEGLKFEIGLNARFQAGITEIQAGNLEKLEKTPPPPDIAHKPTFGSNIGPFFGPFLSVYGSDLLQHKPLTCSLYKKLSKDFDPRATLGSKCFSE
ncbi:hypothetical protein K438DRAFT_1775838 [Mycena galopus ATCC 62051]|nr:hypothetical protein K438DRAFT_1775838 [Mycena galopus ATCC 62051]